MGDLLHKLNNRFCSTPGLKYPPGLTPTMIPNFYKVTELIFRGGEPTYEGWQWLKQASKSDILQINLRAEYDDQPITQRLGIGTVHASIVNFKAPSPLIANQVIRVLQTSKCINFVHCEDGLGRTGTIIALYRMINGMSLQDALTEAYRFKIFGVFKPLTLEQIEFLKSFK
jgi:protein tyrosine phosphatase